jgi:acetyl-CoA synthetase
MSSTMEAADRISDTAPPSYEAAYADFDLEAVKKAFVGDFDSGINACVECCDAHVATGGIALDWEGIDGERRTVTFAELRDMSARFAGFLASQGIGRGDVVSGMLTRTPDLLATILGTWRAGAIYQPLFTAFGPKAIEHRLKMSSSRLVVTDPANRPKLDDVPDAPPIMVVARRGERIANGDFDFTAQMALQSTDFAPVLLTGDDLFLMMSTSGTTGLPKGVPIPLKALMTYRVYMETAIDLRPGDRFWNIADPGWAYGLYYAVTGPLLLGHATTFYEGPFTVESTYRIIESHGITNLAGAPTAYRMIIAAGPEAAERVKGKLRVVSSAGEPLNPEVIRWFGEHLSAPIYDHYGQTETGMVVNNHHGLTHVVHPGSAGLSMPGHRVAVLDFDGNELGPNIPGELAVDLGKSPLHYFTGYWQQQTPQIANGYYRTGDTVELEPDGHISFVGRSDDVITSAGYRIGPFDVESALIEHPSVMEAAVVGKPDPERTEIVKAFVVLRKGFEASDSLADELAQFVKRRLSAHAYPREIQFMEQLPKTPSGKLQRFLLRNAEKAAAEARK